MNDTPATSNALRTASSLAAVSAVPSSVTSELEKRLAFYTN
jgi:hypothetical protein